MSDKLQLDAVLVMDDSPMFMQTLQQQFDGDQIRFLFADTLDAFRHQLKSISGKQHTLSAMLLGPSADQEQITSCLQHLRSQQPRCRWLNIIDLQNGSPPLKELLEERLRFRPYSTLLSTDEQGIQQMLSEVLQAVHLDGSTGDLNARLTDMEERYEMLLDTSTEAIAFVLSGLHIYANPAFLELTGYTDLNSLSEKSLLELVQTNNPEDNLKKALVALEKRSTTKTNLEVSLISDTEKADLPLEAILQPARFSGEECTQVTLRERPIVITANHESSEIDGLLSRHGFLAAAQQILSTDIEGQAIGVLCVSVDDFDSIKDHIGFTNSDALISERASLLLECLSEETDKVARYSEHMFAVLVQRAQRPAVDQLVEHIIDTFSNRIAQIDDTSTTVTCSIGFCFAGRNTKNIDTLISQAVRANREATAEGVQQSKRFRPTLQTVDDGNDRTQWQERIRHAIDHNELKLSTTLISDINDDQQQFLDLDLHLEQTDADGDSDTHLTGTELKQSIAGTALTAELDRHAIRVMLENLQQSSQTLIMPVTASNHDAKALAEWITASLKYSGMPGSRLILSIDSNDLQKNLQPTDVLRKALNGSGIRWVLDNYGATDNAVQLLKHLQPEFTRLTPELVPHTSDMAQAEPFPTLIKTARETNTQVIACNVNSADCLPCLWQVGITLIQGDFLKQKRQVVG